MADRNEKYRAKWAATVQPLVTEPIIAVAQLQPRGSVGAASMAAVSMLASAAMQSAANKEAMHLPRVGVYALTPTVLHVFDVKPKGFGIKVKAHVATFPRSVFAARVAQGSVLDQLDLVFSDGTTIALESISAGFGEFNRPFFERLVSGT